MEKFCVVVKPSSPAQDSQLATMINMWYGTFFIFSKTPFNYTDDTNIIEFILRIKIWRGILSHGKELHYYISSRNEII